MCDNKVSYLGYDYRETMVKCGLTDPFGDRAICNSCYYDPIEMESINRQEAEIEAADNAWARSAGYGEY